VRVIVEKLIDYLPIKERINSELLIDGMAALKIGKTGIRFGTKRGYQ